MKTVIMILMAMIMAAGTMYAQTTDQPPPIPSDEQPEVLTRGPVNEAFAQPVNMDKEGDFTAPKAPPPDIEETPPAEAPAGDQFAWIPGYWAWDTDSDGYIWVSGCWRAVPQGKSWVPGYWTEVADGWRWVDGFWAPANNREIDYLPPPPAVTYVAPPVTEAPDKVWVPPCWYWSGGHYTLRSGYWIDAREDWVWVPSHYVWTPRGYVFVSGYWDYPFRRRGVLFAPVYFRGNIYSGVRFSYSLSIVLDLGNLEFGLFTRPAYNHYYFGDYYDSFYVGIGIFPWFECVTRHTWYDPIYLHDRWRHRRNEPNWWQRERNEYARRRADKNLRPPRTYREMEHRMRNMTESQRRNFEVATPMRRLVEKRMTTFRFRNNKPADRRQISRYSDDVHNYARERSQWESRTEPRTERQVTRSVPSGEHRETLAPAERRARDTRSPEYREFRAPSDRKTPDMRQPEQRQSSSLKRMGSGDEPARGQTGSMNYSRQAKPESSWRNEEKQDKPDSVKVRTSPVLDKNRGYFRKKAPSQPDEEQGDRVEQKRKAHRR